MLSIWNWWWSIDPRWYRFLFFFPRPADARVCFPLLRKKEMPPTQASGSSLRNQDKNIPTPYHGPALFSPPSYHIFFRLRHCRLSWGSGYSRLFSVSLEQTFNQDYTRLACYNRSQRRLMHWFFVIPKNRVANTDAGSHRGTKDPMKVLATQRSLYGYSTHDEAWRMRPEEYGGIIQSNRLSLLVMPSNRSVLLSKDMSHK